MQIKNQCRIDFRYKYSETSPSMPKTMFSNTVYTDIITPPLKVEKLVSTTKASVFSILTFTIKIKNNSATPISNIFIKDLAPCNLIFIANTLTLNCHKIRNVDLKAGYTLPLTLPPNSLVNLQFKMVVKPKSSLKTLVNSALVEYDYLYNTEEPPLRICLYTTSPATFIENDLVKKLTLDKVLDLPCHMPPINIILKGCAKIKISEIKLLLVPIIDDSDEILYKVLILGTIEYKILYSYDDPCSYSNTYRTTTLTYTDGFSTSILVPKGADFFTITNLKSYIEHLNFKKIDSSTIGITSVINFNLY